MRTAILLAAGESRRMGTLKPLLPFGIGSVIGQVVRSLQACPIDAVLVVVGHRGAEIAAHLASGVSIVENPNYLQGMLSSVQAGVAAADPATTLFLIALADQPSIPPEVIRHLLDVFEAKRPGMLVPTFEGRRGHPLLIDARYRDEIATLDPTVGLRELLQRHPDDLLLAPVSFEAVIRDLDTREEYEAELARWERTRVTSDE
jgi:molybdenum cofactor cytidylyltransferase